MKHRRRICTVAILGALVTGAAALGQERSTLIVTASNTASNNLLVYSPSGRRIDTVATGGKGGVSGNAGGIASSHDRLAVVNFGSRNVSIFTRSDAGFRLRQVIPAASSPVSIAFGHNHLYILGSTTVESHPVFDFGVSPGPDGVASLLKADGSAAQVGVLDQQLILTEKSNVIETFPLSAHGEVTGTPTLVSNIPANVNAPFGLVTRDNEAYVTIAHANEISLVRDDSVVTVTGSGTQSAPCWVALDGPWLYSSNSPSQSVSRYLVFGANLIQEQAVAASFTGAPTDIAYHAGFLAVVDGAGTVSHLSVFHVDWDGNLQRQGIATIPAPANGVAVIDGDF